MELSRCRSRTEIGCKAGASVTGGKSAALAILQAMASTIDAAAVCEKFFIGWVSIDLVSQYWASWCGQAPCAMLANFRRRALPARLAGAVPTVRRRESAS